MHTFIYRSSILTSRALCVLLYLSISSCTSMKVVPGWPMPSDPHLGVQASELRVGDELSLTIRPQKQMRFIVTSTEEKVLIGHIKGESETMRIHYDQIVSVERREVAVGKSILVGASAVIGFLATMAFSMAFAP